MKIAWLVNPRKIEIKGNNFCGEFEPHEVLINMKATPISHSDTKHFARNRIDHIKLYLVMMHLA